MKWRNKGKELEKQASHFISIFESKDEKLYIYPAGLYGQELRKKIEPFGCFAGFIDNDQNKQNSNDDIISFEEYQKKSLNGVILVSASEGVSREIADSLRNVGYALGKDFYLAEGFMQEIFPIIVYYKTNKIFIPIAQVSVTERCTLHCKKCAHGCNRVPNTSQDLSLEMVRQSVDYLFKYANFVDEFTIIGGEPMLFKHLEDAVEYIGLNYRNQMRVFSITTNGTVVPSNSLLEKCKKYSVTFRVSDYSNTNPSLAEKYERLYVALENNDVIKWKTQEDSWVDYGYGEFARTDDADLQIVFDSCRTPCREVRGHKYYYCVMARSINENYGHGLPDEYLDLSDCTKTEFLEFNMGYSEKGYLEMCRFCRGAEAMNYPITAAEQE